MSFSGVPLTVIVIAAIFVAIAGLAFTGFRRALLSGLVAFYPATLIFQYFPWFSPTTATAAVGLWVGCFAVCFLALRNRVDGAPWPRLGRPVASIAIALAALAEFVALYVSILPLDTFFLLPTWLTAGAQISFALPIVLGLLWVF